MTTVIILASWVAVSAIFAVRWAKNSNTDRIEEIDGSF